MGIEELVGKEVEVDTAEIIYRGILIEVNESEVHLQSQYGWVTVTMDRIVDIRAVE